ncbi:MAG TPA: MaoC/PaaZ C-terminal domain-containing protein [Anaeromyxobacteraceae bacterium]|nr:MaoC/PaaZ C-terminal domain-containing protein [Anaeromyxobacteraceae bacterium]
MALLARQLYFEAIKVGDELPPLVKPPIDRMQIARYAGASGDYNPLYVDELLSKNAGFPSALAPGMLAMGFAGELVVDWLRGARLRRFGARFVKIVWPGDVITCRGKVVDRRFEGEGVYAADIELWAENQRGELVLKGLVTTQLYYNAEDDAKQRAGGPPLVVTPQEEEIVVTGLASWWRDVAGRGASALLRRGWVAAVVCATSGNGKRRAEAPAERSER